MYVSERDYETFTLRWLEGLSVREVARRLGRTEAQVWVRLKELPDRSPRDVRYSTFAVITVTLQRRPRACAAEP